MVVHRVGEAGIADTIRARHGADVDRLAVRKNDALPGDEHTVKEAGKAIKEPTRAHVPKRQAEELSKAIRTDFDESYASRPAEEAHEGTEEADAAEKDGNDLLVISTDGKEIVVRKKDLREATRKKAAAAIARYRRDVLVIQDFVHVLEYLGKSAYCFHADGTPEAEAWVLERAHALLQSKVSDVAAEMRRSATRQGLSQEERTSVDRCADYLLKNKDRFDYASALANGWPIAAGIIEGACRHVVKDRMDLTGARWSLDGAEAVLRLRSLRANGDFEDYMACHHRQERPRNYVSAPPTEDIPLAA